MAPDDAALLPWSVGVPSEVGDGSENGTESPLTQKASTRRSTSRRSGTGRSASAEVWEGVSALDP
eukprot:2614818-Prymnesium_polylepis.1